MVPMMALMMFFLSCNDNASQKAEQARLDSIARVDSIHKADSIAREDSIKKALEDSIARESSIITFITDMYNNKKFEDYSFLKSHCSATVMKQLRADYDYDDGGLATWDFRSNAQDGPNNKHCIISVEPQGDGWYKYTFYDMGNKASRKIKVSENNGDFLIEGLK